MRHSREPFALNARELMIREIIQDFPQTTEAFDEDILEDLIIFKDLPQSGDEPYYSSYRLMIKYSHTMRVWLHQYLTCLTDANLIKAYQSMYCERYR